MCKPFEKIRLVSAPVKNDRQVSCQYHNPQLDPTQNCSITETTPPTLLTSSNVSVPDLARVSRLFTSFLITVTECLVKLNRQPTPNCFMIELSPLPLMVSFESRCTKQSDCPEIVRKLVRRRANTRILNPRARITTTVEFMSSLEHAFDHVHNITTHSGKWELSQSHHPSPAPSPSLPPRTKRDQTWCRVGRPAVHTKCVYLHEEPLFMLHPGVLP